MGDEIWLEINSIATGAHLHGLKVFAFQWIPIGGTHFPICPKILYSSEMTRLCDCNIEGGNKNEIKRKILFTFLS